MDEWTKPLESGRKIYSVYIYKKSCHFSPLNMCANFIQVLPNRYFPPLNVFSWFISNQSRYHVIMPRRCKNIRLSASSFSDFDYRYFNSLCMGLSSYSFGHFTGCGCT